MEDLGVLVMNRAPLCMVLYKPRPKIEFLPQRACNRSVKQKVGGGCRQTSARAQWDAIHPWHRQQQSQYASGLAIVKIWLVSLAQERFEKEDNRFTLQRYVLCGKTNVYLLGLHIWKGSCSCLDE